MCMLNFRKFKIGLKENIFFLSSKIGLKILWAEIKKNSRFKFFLVFFYA